MLKHIKILHIDDDIADALLLKTNFQDSPLDIDYSISHAMTINDALEKISGEEFDVIILDYCLDYKDGTTHLKTLRMVAPLIPVIILTSVENDEIALKTLQLGAQEFLIKNSDNAINYQFVVHSAIQRKKAETSLVEGENYSPLTGLEKKKLFLSNLKHRINWLKPFGYNEVTFIIYIENASIIENNFGSEVYNKVMLDVAFILKRLLNIEDLLSHYEDNIFCISKTNKTGDIDKTVEASEDFIQSVVDLLEKNEIYIYEKKEFVKINFNYSTLIYPLIGKEFTDVQQHISNSIDMLKQTIISRTA